LGAVLDNPQDAYSILLKNSVLSIDLAARPSPASLKETT